MNETKITDNFNLAAFRAKRDKAIANKRRWLTTAEDIRWAYEQGERDFSSAFLHRADLSDTNLSNVNLSDAILSSVNLSDANLRRANLSNADLSKADLSGANLSGANLSKALLSRTNLVDTNLSGAVGLLSPTEYMEKHFETTSEGYIVYKVFGAVFKPPAAWEIAPNSILTEVTNPTATSDCASGINVATLAWLEVEYPNSPIWKCLIEWKWLPGVVVPYNTDGVIRAERVRLIEIVQS